MFEGSNRRFGVTTTISGLSHGIVVNNISLNDSLESAEARDHKGNIIDIAVYGEGDQVSIDGVYVGDGVEAGTIIKVDDKSYLVTTTSRNEDNTAFQTASVNAMYYPGQEPPVPPGPEPPVDLSTALTFKAVNEMGGVALNRYNATSSSLDLKYNKNDQGWETYTLGQTIVLDQNDTVAFSGNNSYFSNNNFYYFTMGGQIEAYGNVMSLMNFSDSCTNYCFRSLFRDCTSLIKAPELPATGLATGCYNGMFNGCTNLVTAPSVLPAKFVNEYSYAHMFANCTSLTAGPQLPAYRQQLGSYEGMFSGCVSLTDAPKLPLIVVSDTSNRELFAGCSSLSSIDISILAWDDNNLNQSMYWVSGVAQNGIFYKQDVLPEKYGYSYIPSGWQVVDKPTPLTFQAWQITGAVALEQYGSPDAIDLKYSKNNGPWTTYNIGDVIAIELWSTVAFSGNNDHFSKDSNNYYKFIMTGNILPLGNIQSLMNFSNSVPCGCYSFLFEGCDSLTYVGNGHPFITLPVTSLASGCYWGMFQNCTGLRRTPQLSATTLAPYCYQQMFYNCSSLVSTYQLPATTLADGCCIDMFKGCKSLSTVPYNMLPANNLAPGCYMEMFKDCYSLINAPALSATTLATGCYSSMFANCSSLINPRKLPATSLVDGCYAYMFSNCKSLTAAPELSATELAYQCYRGMFESCSNISSINVNFTDWGRGDNTGAWVYNVASTGIFYKPYDLLEQYDIDHIPSGWQVVNKDQPVENNPLTFKVVGNPGNVKLAMIHDGNEYNDITIKYKKNNDEWKDFFIITPSTSSQLRQYIDLQEGDIISFSGSTEHLSRGTNNYCIFHTQFSSPNPFYFEIYGNIQSLVNNKESLTDEYQYYKLFGYLSSINDASKLILPNNTTRYCYREIFKGCEYLTAAPQLPATSLTDNCYYRMFQNCSGLVVPPSTLPATTLIPQCYEQMFYNCSSLIVAPQLPATELASACYRDMFYNCYSLSSIPTLPALSTVPHCYDRMFYNCSSLVSVQLPITKIAYTSEDDGSMYGMFAGCTSLSSISVNFTEWGLESNVYRWGSTGSWVYNVAANGTFYKPSALSAEYDIDHIPSGWQVVDKD